jgi:sugar phosphate isomerase/epimerase
MALIFTKGKYLLILSFFTFFCQLCRAQEIGLELYSVRNQLKKDVPGTLAEIKRWHIKEIEGGDTYGLKKEEFKKMLKENGLKVVSVGVDYNELSTDPKAAIENAKSYGASFIVCFWIPHIGTDFTIEDVKKAIDVFAKAGKLIHENGLQLCYHPHGYEFRPFENGTLFDYLVRKTDPQYLQFEMDVFWVKHPGQDPVALLKKYPNRFVMLHLKDRKQGTEGNQNGQADEETNVVLGQGDVNIAAVMKEAKRIGIKHYFIEDESSRPEQQIPQSLTYLHNLKK